MPEKGNKGNRSESGEPVRNEAQSDGRLGSLAPFEVDGIMESAPEWARSAIQNDVHSNDPMEMDTARDLIEWFSENEYPYFASRVYQSTIEYMEDRGVPESEVDLDPVSLLLNEEQLEELLEYKKQSTQ